MFTNKLAISRVDERLEAIEDKCNENGYLSVNYINHTYGNEHYTSTFKCDPFAFIFFERWHYEFTEIKALRDKCGVNGNNTLLVFEGVNHSSRTKAIETVKQSLNFTPIEVKIQAHESDLTQQEHFLFVGFENRDDLLKFTSTFGRKTTEEVLALWDESMALDRTNETDLLSGIGDLIDA